jgi:paraquat-inducible protein B
MNKHHNLALIGAFVIGAVVLLFLAILIWGGGRFFSERVQYVLYFERSVKGLQIGAPVDFRGVKIGTVTDIQVHFDRKERIFRIPVYIELEPNRLTEVCCAEETSQMARKRYLATMINKLVDRGLRARVEQESLVTGLLYVQLDFFPGTPINLVGTEAEVVELPTIPSSLQQISEKFEKLPLEALITKVMQVVEGLEHFVNSPELKKSIRSLNQTLDTVEGLASNVDRRIVPLTTGVNAVLTDVQVLVKNINNTADPVLSGLENVSRDTQNAIMEAQKVFASVNGMVAEHSPLRFELEQTLAEISAASRSIRQMAEYFKRHPESLIYGKRKVQER